MGNLKVRDHLGDREVNERMMLKSIPFALIDSIQQAQDRENGWLL
jgi:hypothetical protein